ncbi:MAG: oxidoreductase, partial [Mesorhizobium sp.]
MGRFNGATVLISGATGGLGCGAARAFAAEGARLVLSDLNEA